MPADALSDEEGGMRGWLIGLAMIVALGAMGGGVLAQDATPAASPVASPLADPPGVPQANLGGNAIIPPAMTSALEVVLRGPYDGTRMPIVVRNGTDQPVANVKVAITVRDAAGGLLAVGEQEGAFAPYTVAPGDAAIGSVLFNGASFGPDAVLDIAVAGQVPDERFLTFADMQVVEFNVQGDQILAIISNPYDRATAESLTLGIMCFDASGNIVAFARDYASVAAIAAGGTVPVSASLPAGSCDRYAIAATALIF